MDVEKVQELLLAKYGPASGQSYEGQWKNNKRHGKGKMINEADIKTGYEGGVEEGYWVKNKQMKDKDILN